MIDCLASGGVVMCQASLGEAAVAFVVGFFVLAWAFYVDPFGGFR